MYNMCEEPYQRREKTVILEVICSLRTIGVCLYGHPGTSSQDRTRESLSISGNRPVSRTVPLRTITALVVSKAFCDHCVFSHRPPRYLLTENVAQFPAKLFLAVCQELGIDKDFKTAYYPQTNGQVERFN
jgi:transposase InsO family protein